MCRDTMCVSNSKLCDGRLDCKDGSDESFCEFVCKNGDTIRELNIFINKIHLKGLVDVNPSDLSFK